MKKSKLNLILKNSIVLLLLIVLVTMTGCQNNRQHVSMKRIDYTFTYTIEDDPNDDRRDLITYVIVVRNKTVRSLKGINYKLVFYNNDEVISNSKDLTFDKKVMKHGCSFSFQKKLSYVKTSVDDIKLEVTSVQKQNFWKTYMWEFIAMITLIISAFTANPIALFGDFIGYVIVILVLFPLVAGGGKYFYFNWVPFAFSAIPLAGGIVIMCFNS